jgi:hypothetical protein
MANFAEMGTPEHWRQHARETRADAEQYVDPETKKRLLDIAILYDRLAEITEKRASS